MRTHVKKNKNWKSSRNNHSSLMLDELTVRNRGVGGKEILVLSDVTSKSYVVGNICYLYLSVFEFEKGC